MERSWLDRIRTALQYLFGRWPVLVHDATAACLAWLGAYWFRFNLDRIPDVFLDQALHFMGGFSRIVKDFTPFENIALSDVI